MTSPAIREVGWLPLQGPGMSIEACFLIGDVQRLDPDMFAAASMVCPDVVARSVPQRQAHFFLGRMAARMAATRSGLALADVPIGAFGEPCWPQALIGSITHSQGLVVAAVAVLSPLHAIGIDIEHVAEPPGLDALLSIAIDPAERSILEAATTHLPIAALATITFSAKESLFKAIFPTVRRMLGFEAAKLVSFNDHAGTLTFAFADQLATALPCGKHGSVNFRMLTPQVAFTSMVC